MIVKRLSRRAVMRLAIVAAVFVTEWADWKLFHTPANWITPAVGFASDQGIRTG